MAKQKTVLDFQEEIQKKRRAALAMPQKARSSEAERPIIVSDIISLSENRLLAKQSRLISVTKKGLIFQMSAKQILAPKQSILKTFLNHHVELFLSNYELPMNGLVKDVSLVGENSFEIFIGFTENTPSFYRACVEDLLN